MQRNDADVARAVLYDAREVIPDAAESAAAVGGSHVDDVLPLTDAEADAKVERLAGLSSIKYGRERTAAAKEIGIPVGYLDRLVRQKGAEAESTGQGRPIELPDPEPWEEVVDGAGLLDAITAAVRSFMIMEPGAAEITALWSVHAHALGAFGISPRLTITSPRPGCGKTTLLDILAHLVPRPLQMANTSVAAVYRTIEAAAPCLLVDEADTFLVGNDELRGVLNSGHRRGGSVIRVVGEDLEPRQFATWGACAIAMIGKLPGTLSDRSVPITLKRKRPDEVVDKFRFDRTENLDALARQAARWAKDNHRRLAMLDPTVPSALDNRAADNWRVLLAVAETAGGNWPKRARDIAISTTDAEQSKRVSLLADIWEVFNSDKRVVKTDGEGKLIASEVLVDALVAMEGHPWAEHRNGKPLTKNQLARLLSSDGISPGTVRVGKDQTPKGYKLAQFTDAFARYLPSFAQNSSYPPNQNATTPQPAETLGFQGVFETPQPEPCGGLQYAEKPQNPAPCGGVAFRNGGEREEDAKLTWGAEL